MKRRRRKVIYVSQNVFINWISEVNSTAKFSSHRLPLLIKILSSRFCGGGDFQKLLLNALCEERFREISKDSPSLGF